MEIGVYTPIDIRKLKYTKEKMGQGIFQYNVSCVIPFVKKMSNILEQIKHCQEEFKNVIIL